MNGYKCEHCAGTVREKLSEREAFKHKGSFVILENVPIGVCDTCGARYFSAKVLRRVAEIGRGIKPPLRKEEVAVADCV